MKPLIKKELPIVLIGPPQSGKTSFLSHLSSRVESMVFAPDPTHPVTLQSTTLSYPKEQPFFEFQFYSTPSSPQFEFIWKTFSKQALGLIIVIDASRATAQTDLEFALQQVLPFYHSQQIVIVLNHLDPFIPSAILMQPFLDFLKKHQLTIPVLPIDCRQPSDVRYVFDAFLSRCALGFSSDKKG